jgi:hypothetical protein
METDNPSRAKVLKGYADQNQRRMRCERRRRRQETKTEGYQIDTPLHYQFTILPIPVRSDSTQIWCSLVSPKQENNRREGNLTNDSDETRWDNYPFFTVARSWSPTTERKRTLPRSMHSRSTVPCSIPALPITAALTLTGSLHAVRLQLWLRPQFITTTKWPKLK